MSRARFDLHVHSTASDGLLQPREVVALAAERGLAGVALTDHDTVGGIAEAVGMGEALGIRCIPGVELACTSGQGEEVHLLGYFIDPQDPDLGRLFERMRAERLARTRAIVERVAALDADLTMQDVLAESGDAPAGRPHIARAMVRRGIVPDVDSAFSEEWIGGGGRAFVARQVLTVEAAIGAIHRAGGVAVIAHPGAHRRDGIPEQSIRHAAQAGLDGLEVDHPSHDGDAVERSVGLAVELGLVQTAGSDDHAQGVSGSRLGCRTVPARIVDALEARAVARRTSQ